MARERWCRLPIPRSRTQPPRRRLLPRNRDRPQFHRRPISARFKRRQIRSQLRTDYLREVTQQITRASIMNLFKTVAGCVLFCLLTFVHLSAGAEAKITTVAVTAAITGGTALLEANKGFPTKLLMLEGIGRFYPTGHPVQAAIVHGGEMAMMTVDGQITRPTKFNAALVYKTSKLITSFPTLPNADLILAVIDEQQAGQLGGP